MTPRTLPFAAIALLAVASLSAQTPLTPGNLVVYRIGDGSAALSGAATATFLDEYTTSGALVQSIPLPTAASGSNLPLTNSGTATAEGSLTLSASGQFLMVGGYAATPGTPTIASTTAAAAPRVVGRLDMSGVVDTSTTFGTAFSGLGLRSCASADGVQFYGVGSNGGCQYTILGGNTPTQINSALPTNMRVANVTNGQLYFSAASGAFQGVGTIGTGLPTIGGQTPVLLPGFPIVTGPQSYDFVFADATTLYVADDRAAPNGGVQKWTLTGGAWSLAYTLSTPSGGCRGLAVSTTCGVTTIYATTTQTAVNQIVAAIDTGSGSTFATVATAGVNTVFRGLELLAIPSQAIASGTGSPSSNGVPTIAVTAGAPVVGNSAFTIGSQNWPPFTGGALVITVGSLIPGGVQLPGGQPGALLYAPLPETFLFIQFADILGTASAQVPVPCTPALAGLSAAAQWLVLDVSLPYSLQLATSAGMQLVVGG